MPRRHFLRLARRVLLIALAVLLALSAAGAIYESWSVRRDAARFPPPGRLIDVGGRRLHVICIGRGEPAVVFESSGFGNSVSAEAARITLRAETRVCSYDRMGTAWSDPAPGVVSLGMLADDLKTLLERSEVRPPYILVPSSIGGLTAEMFARRYPDRVAGLVFLDAANSDSGIVERASSASTIQREAVCLARIAARLGLVRIADPLGFRTLPRGTADRAMAQTYRADTVDTACALVRGIPQSVQELREAPPLRSDVPLTVLIAETAGGLGPPALQPQAEALAAAFHESQKRFARRSTRGSWRIVPNSDHLIASRQPQAVSSAVLGMLNEVRRTAHPR